MGEAISAFELIPAQSFDFLTETHPDLQHPFQETPAWSILTEFGMGPGSAPQDRMAKVFETAFEAGIALDGTIAQSGKQRDAFWALRETIPEANRRIGSIASHDISLPLSEIPGFITDTKSALERVLPCRINAFGHLGDGNLHYNVFPPVGEDRATYRPKAPDVTRLIHDRVTARGGSFSAEHGVGRAKVNELERLGDPAKLAVMQAIKTALDPIGIMNPGAVLR